MSCSATSNTGFVHITGPIQPSELQSITDISYFPLSFAFAPRTTIPTLISSNQIDENIGNSCIYLGKRFNLTNVQLCSSLHRGYKLPGDTQIPVAECILTYTPSSTSDSPNPLSGILLCFPIYDSGPPEYDGYLDQIVTDTEIPCGYETIRGKVYEGNNQQTIQDTTLRKCIKSCCDDTNCLAYTFGNGTCHIKHTIPDLLSTGDDTISGKINRKQVASACTSSTPNALVYDIQSIMYKPDGTTTHSIIAYKTCIETNANTTLGLYVFVFPKGIRMRSSSYQQLVLRANGILPEYTIPPAIRGYSSELRGYVATLLRYRMDNGRKVPIGYSDGKAYITNVSACTEEFRKGMEYFILPPNRMRKPSRSRAKPIVEAFTSSESSESSESCKHLTTEQYKCVPFNEATDLSGNLVIPGHTTLEEILKKQKESKGDKGNIGSLSTDAVEGIIGISICGIIILYAGYRALTYIYNRPT